MYHFEKEEQLMAAISEIGKFLKLAMFLKMTFLRAVFSKDKASRRILTELHLKGAAQESKVPTRSLKVDPEESFTVSNLLLADFSEEMDRRFLLLSLEELLNLLTLFRETKPRKVFEFGLLRGGSLYHFIKNSSSEVEIHSLDMYLTNLHPTVRNLVAQEPRVKLHQGNSLRFNTSELKGSIDFIFIDGGHDYEVVQNDTQKALELLSPTGTIVWDDYQPGFPGVFRCVNELASKENIFHVEGTKLAYLKRGQ